MSSPFEKSSQDQVDKKSSTSQPVLRKMISYHQNFQKLLMSNTASRTHLNVLQSSFKLSFVSMKKSHFWRIVLHLENLQYKRG